MELKAPDFRKREDKLSGWLDGEVRTFLFDSFSDDYCTRTGMEFLRGVDIPIKPGDLAAFHGEGGLPVTDLADNMALVIGANTQFKYRDAYIAYLALYFNEKLVDVLAQKGAEELKAQHYRKSCIYFRAALLLDSQNKQAMFGYACCCREWYLSMEGEDQQELISLLKKESTEYFEHVTRVYPEDAAAYYFLGYAYVNAGQYRKSQLAWKKFLQLSEKQEGGAAAVPRGELRVPGGAIHGGRRRGKRGKVPQKSGDHKKEQGIENKKDRPPGSCPGRTAERPGHAAGCSRNARLLRFF